MKKNNPLLVIPWIAGALIGAGVMWTISGPVSNDVPTELNEALHGVAEGLIDFRRGVEQQLENQPSRAVSPQPIVSRVPIDQHEMRSVISRLTALEAQLQSMTVKEASSSQKLSQNLIARGRTIPDTYPQNSLALSDLKELSGVDLAVSFLGWTYQDVLERFGSPNSVNNKGGTVYFDYSPLREGGTVEIKFEEQRVVEIDAYWDG